MHLLTKSLTATILIFTLLSAGCTDTGSSSANNPTAVATATQAATAEPTEVPWYIDRSGFGDAEVGTYSTLFDEDITGVKNGVSIGSSYNIFDIESSERILKHQEFPHFDPYDDLQPDQARALEAQYGEAKLVVMEQADTDGDGAQDRVAVRYVGSKGTWEFEDDVHPYAGLVNYISANIMK